MDPKKFIPERLQTLKELSRQGSNFFFFLFIIQVTCADVLAKFDIHPVINWQESFLLYVIFMGPLTWISNHQEAEKRNGTGTGSPTIPPTAPSDPPSAS